MSGDYDWAREVAQEVGKAQVPRIIDHDGNPYEHMTHRGAQEVARKTIVIASGTRRRTLVIDKGERDPLEFDAQTDYIKLMVEKLSDYSPDSVPQGVIVSQRRFFKESGLTVVNTVVTRNGVLKRELVEQQIHPHQHFIDEGREKRKAMKTMARMAARRDVPEEARTLLTRVLKILNTPISLKKGDVDVAP